MIGMKLNQAKTMFLDRKAVTDRLDRAQIRIFNRVGGQARTIARRSMRPASRKLLGQAYLIRSKLRNAKGDERRRLQAELIAIRKRTHSRPGQPPKYITKLLRDNIFFVADLGPPISVVVGPILLNKSSGAQERLEFGGILNIGPRPAYMEARPYMGPAKQKVEPTVADMFRDSVTNKT